MSGQQQGSAWNPEASRMSATGGTRFGKNEIESVIGQTNSQREGNKPSSFFSWRVWMYYIQNLSLTV